jgi:predicted acetylornithine/succinylornithine family transaminase
MNTQEIKDMHERYVMPTYAPGLALVRGRGPRVWDADGKEYLDFASGIAVTTLGHCHPNLVRAIRKQAARLMHVSNLYYNELQPRLAKALSERSLGGKCFFCNSGAEANEGLIKLARLWGADRGKHEIITMRGSFHGRTLATLTATGQDKVKKGFAPLPEGFRLADLNDLESCRAVMNDQTAAVLVEGVQGEGGVVPTDPDYLKALQVVCEARDILLFCDEVQCGMGRTGHWFGYQRAEVRPDAISLAKGLGGGFPIGAIVTGPKLADVFQPGAHATTFGGTPLACAAALAVIETIEQEQLVQHAREMGEYFVQKLQPLVQKYDWVRDVRGAGLMLGLVLDRPAKPMEENLQHKGLLAIATADRVIRLLPPLNVRKSHINKAVKALQRSCKELEQKKAE